jgi:ribonuclease P protein component
VTVLPVQGLRLPRSLRLRSAREFRRVYQRGRRVTSARLVVVGLWNGSEVLRVGLSVSKEHGPAVRRNKIKRLLREAFRHERPGLPPGFDLVLIPRPGSERWQLAALRAELATLVRRLHAERDRPRAGRRERR